MRRISIIILVLFFANINCFAQLNSFSKVKEYFATGSATNLSTCFSNNISCSILGTENFYSRSQFAVVFKDFFTNYKPKNFEIRHQKIDESGRIYLIGIYSTQSGENFRVTIYAKQESEFEIYILQIKIEK
jgi:hypothetical protein